MRYFTQHFRTALTSNANVLNSAHLKLVLFQTSPSGNGSLDYSGYSTVNALTAIPGWEQAIAGGYPFTGAGVEVVPAPVGGSVFTQVVFKLTQLTEKVEVSAVGVQYIGTLNSVTDPLIYVTDEPFPNGRRVLDADDEITPFENVVAVGPPATKMRWLFSWDDTADGAQRERSLTSSDLAVGIGPPDFQSAHHFDTWLYPQRVNYICNPSFEAISNVYWGTNGTFARVISPFGGYMGKFTGNEVVVESNKFPTTDESAWTIQCNVRGSGKLQLGLVYWDASYNQTYVDWGEERWTLNPNGFTPIKCVRNVAEGVQALLRLQVMGGNEITLDKVLVEPGVLLDWPYFDGDEQYGACGDYSWYGERGASYSLWYNNRNSIVNRIFTKPSYSGNIFTEKESAKDGLAYQWVPAGTVLEYHLDVLYPHDQKVSPIPKSGVLPPDTSDPIYGVDIAQEGVLTTTAEVILTTDGQDLTTT